MEFFYIKKMIINNFFDISWSLKKTQEDFMDVQFWKDDFSPGYVIKIIYMSTNEINLQVS